MSHYIMELRRYLMFECACVTSRGGKEGVFDYTQKKFAFHSISRNGGKISEANVVRIYDSGYFWADNPEEIFVAKDIIEVDGCFNALKFCIDNMDELITAEYVAEMHSRLYPGTPLHMQENLKHLISAYAREPEAGNPTIRQDITDFHIRFIQYGGDSRTASLISYMQCINNFLTPFYIHAENQAMYERYLKNIYNNAGKNYDFAEMYRNKMEWLFKVERERYRRETEAMVIEQQVQ